MDEEEFRDLEKRTTDLEISFEKQKKSLRDAKQKIAALRVVVAVLLVLVGIPWLVFLFAIFSTLTS